MIEHNGGQYWFDAQIGTFMAQVSGVVYGTHTGNFMTAQALASAVGIALPAELLIALDAEKVSLVASGQYMPPTISKSEFLHRFTATERTAILTASKSSIVVEGYLFLIQARDTIELSDPEISSGVRLIEQAGIIAAGRASQILGV